MGVMGLQQLTMYTVKQVDGLLSEAFVRIVALIFGDS